MSDFETLSFQIDIIQGMTPNTTHVIILDQPGINNDPSDAVSTRTTSQATGLKGKIKSLEACIADQVCCRCI